MMIPLLLTALALTIGTPDTMARLVDYHVRRYPKLQVQDMYKLLYQGEFGIGHLLGDGQHARRYLLEELAGLDSTSGEEELFEPVSADGKMVRVNLRPFKRLGHSPELLLQAMLTTAAETRGDTARFLESWREFVRCAQSSSFNTEELRAWDERIRRRDLPVVHHSPAYEQAYRPAYRVCRRSAVEPLRAPAGGGRR